MNNLNITALIIITLAVNSLAESNLFRGYRQIPEATLKADGPKGTETYTLIEKTFGTGSAHRERENSSSVKNIREVIDPEEGNCFEFTAGSTIRKDKSGKFSELQKTEVQIHDRSKESIKPQENDSFLYKWKFRVDSRISLSKQFTRFFQIRSSGNGDGRDPLITFTGVKKSGMDEFQIIYYHSGKPRILTEIPWQMVKGRWIEAEVSARFSDHGALHIMLKSRKDSLKIETSNDGIDLWREDSPVIRPAWGICRSLKGNINSSQAGMRITAIEIFRLVRDDKIKNLPEYDI